MAIIGGIATLYERREIFEEAFHEIIPQVDQLYVTLSGYASVPEFLKKEPKALSVVPSSREGAEAKFFASILCKPKDVYFTFDDDIVYPADYVKTLRRELKKYPGTAVCVHGSKIRNPGAPYFQAQEILHFLKPLGRNQFVHVAGTGTLAFRPFDVPVSRESFPLPNMADILFSIAARRYEVPIIALARKERWLGYRKPEGPTIYETSLTDHRIQTELLRIWTPWPELPELLE